MLNVLSILLVPQPPKGGTPTDYAEKGNVVGPS